MFWGITIKTGKIYCQVAERSFHLSMAALGFEDVSSDPISVMVEIDKAQFVLCTLQAGKIPQQMLDHNFTEGEEVRFFLEGGKGEVHLTGYLFETPQEVGYDEFQALTDSEESESSANSAEDAEKDSSVSSNEAAPGELASLNELDSDDDDEEDEDWTPEKFKQEKEKKRTKKENPVQMVMGLDNYDSEEDEDWIPKGKSSSDESMDEEGSEDSDYRDQESDEASNLNENTDNFSKAVLAELCNVAGSSAKSLGTSNEGSFSWTNFLIEDLPEDSSSDEDNDWKPKEVKEMVISKLKKRNKAKHSVHERLPANGKDDPGEEKIDDELLKKKDLEHIPTTESHSTEEMEIGTSENRLS